jgi:hypothetical protein
MVAARAWSGKTSSRRPANGGGSCDGGAEVSLEFGVEDPSRPESSTAVSLSKSVPSSEASRFGGGRTAEVEDEFRLGERSLDECKGDRIRYRCPDEVIFDMPCSRN